MNDVLAKQLLARLDWLTFPQTQPGQVKISIKKVRAMIAILTEVQPVLVELIMENEKLRRFYEVSIK